MFYRVILFLFIFSSVASADIEVVSGSRAEFWNKLYESYRNHYGLIDVNVKVRFVRIEMLNRRFPGLGHKAGAWDGRTIWVGNDGDQINTFIHELSHVYGYGEAESTRRATQDLDLIIADAGV